MLTQCRGGSVTHRTQFTCVCACSHMHGKDTDMQSRAHVWGCTHTRSQEAQQHVEQGTCLDLHSHVCVGKTVTCRAGHTRGDMHSHICVVCGTHILVFTGETGAVQLVHSHDHSHDILAIHDGHGQDVPCGVAGELVGKGAEVGTLVGGE